MFFSAQGSYPPSATGYRVRNRDPTPSAHRPPSHATHIAFALIAALVRYGRAPMCRAGVAAFAPQLRTTCGVLCSNSDAHICDVDLPCSLFRISDVSMSAGGQPAVRSDDFIFDVWRRGLRHARPAGFKKPQQWCASPSRAPFPSEEHVLGLDRMPSRMPCLQTDACRSPFWAPWQAFLFARRFLYL